MTTESPCVGICTMDEAGYCIGCGRTLAEIEGRPAADDGEKEGIARDCNQ